MTSREIIVCSEVGLKQDECGKYIVSKSGYPSYAVRKDSRIETILRILDNRCQAQQRRYACANDIIESLQQKLQEITDTKLYRFFHILGLM